MIVQIYETQSSEEASSLVAAGVDHVGVLVGKGEYPREFGAEQAREILRSVTRPAKRLALLLSYNLREISEIIEEIKPDILHLGAVPESFLPQDLQKLKQRFSYLPIMRSIPVIGRQSIDLAKEYDGVADYLLLDTQKPGETQVGATGEIHDWDVSRQIVESVRVPVVLAGGLGPDNVAQAILRVNPFGVDSKTKTDKAGNHEKDIEKVRRFVRIAKGNETNLAAD